MFCAKCGNQVNDQAVVCPHCGCATENNVSNNGIVATEEKKTLANCALVFAVLIPIVGLILGIIGCVKYTDEKLKKQCIISIPIAIVVWIIGMLVLL